MDNMTSPLKTVAILRCTENVKESQLNPQNSRCVGLIATEADLNPVVYTLEQHLFESWGGFSATNAICPHPYPDHKYWFINLEHS